MEFLLHFWDELDDMVAVCRHVTLSTVATLTIWVLRVPGN
jgi:hypothetical protein